MSNATLVDGKYGHGNTSEGRMVLGNRIDHNFLLARAVGKQVARYSSPDPRSTNDALAATSFMMAHDAPQTPKYIGQDFTDLCTPMKSSAPNDQTLELSIPERHVFALGKQ